MANTLSTKKKLVMLAAAVADKMDYIKNSDDTIFGELKGAKYGRKVTGYLADPGTTRSGIVASPQSLKEVEISTYLQNRNTSVELSLWDRDFYLESYKKEVLDPRAGKLARDIQKSIMDKCVYGSCQAVATSTIGFGLLTDAASKLEELAVDGEIVTFMTPTINGKIAEGGLSRYIPSDIQKDIYGEAYLGQYSGSAQVSIAGLPVLDTTGVDTAPTATAEVIKDSNGNVIGVKPISTITTSGSGALKVGVPYTVSGLYVVDQSGMRTNQPYVIILNQDVVVAEDGTESTVTYVPEIRIGTPDDGQNPNAWMSVADITSALSGDDVTLTLGLMSGISASKKYQIGQCRQVKALAYSAPKFDDLPVTKSDTVGTFGGVTVKTMAASNLINGTEAIRWDFPYAAMIKDPRLSVTVYIEL